jgi:hypothetical protein
MAGPQDLLLPGEGALEDGDGLVAEPGAEVGLGELRARGQGVRVPGSLDPLAVGQRAFGQPDGIPAAAGRAVGAVRLFLAFSVSG